MHNMMIRFIFLLTILLPTLSSAMFVDNIFVFGDSLSDSGNVYNTTGKLFPPLPYVQRFSNGPVAVEQFATMAGVTLQPSTDGGSNYAFGGAATGAIPGTADVLSGRTNIDNYLAASLGLTFLNGTGIQNQINAFDTLGINFNPNHSLFVVWGGPNDIFTWLDEFSKATINEVVTSAVSNIIQSINTLENQGAENILIPNMVDLGNTPFGNSLGDIKRAGLSQISNNFNASLEQSLDAFVNVNIFRPDINKLLQLVQANPLAYGFDNATDACLDVLTSTPTICQHPDRYLFWDNVHPTEHGHALIAGEFYASAIPEPPVIALISLAMLIGFCFRSTSFR